MCGIVGFNFSNKSSLQTMLSSIKYRGPDDEGVYTDSLVSLGHVRLSILDLSTLGHQPMEFENLVIVYNGEVYNFKDIRKELEKCGYEFRSNTDTEVVLKSFHEWGIDCVQKFRGMFAFCIYDKVKKEFTLVRDRVGVKPLYYYFDGNEFIFASEVKSINAIKKLNINKKALGDFFQYGYIRGEDSIYENVFKLKPGYYLKFNILTKKLEKRAYWDIKDHFGDLIGKSENEILEELESVLVESFKYRMVSDVPVGVFLSGGADSSVVSAILQKHYGNIHTFTIGFKEQKYNEAGYARKIASHLGTSHTEKILEIHEAKEILKNFVKIYDEPFGDSSGIPTYLVSRLAKENGVKVVLSADGGDELFCGYDRYWWVYNLGSKLRKIPFKQTVYKFLQKTKPFFLNIPLKNFEHRYEFLMNVLEADSWQEMYETMIKSYREEVSELIGLQVDFREDVYFKTGEKIHPMQGMMLWDFTNYLPDDILVKVDRATMFNSIEGRDPLIDHKIIEFVAKIPFELKYKNGESKYILKKLLERYLPKELIYRKKMGFGIPIFEWFRADLKGMFEEYFKEDDEIVNMNYVRKLFEQFKSGKYVNINKLWFVLVYKMWKREWIVDS